MESPICVDSRFSPSSFPFSQLTMETWTCASPDQTSVDTASVMVPPLSSDVIEAGFAGFVLPNGVRGDQAGPAAVG